MLGDTLRSARPLPVRSTLLFVLASTITTSAVQSTPDVPAARKPASAAIGEAPPSVAPIQPISVSLADLGYTQDLTLRGAAAGTAISFPLPTYGIYAGELLLHVSPSTALQDRSIVRLLIDDSPVASTTVAALRQAPVWRVPLAATRKPYLSLRLESALSIGTDRCEDLQSGNLWITIGRDSRAAWTPAAGLPSIAEFFRFPGGRLLVRGK